MKRLLVALMAALILVLPALAADPDPQSFWNKDTLDRRAEEIRAAQGQSLRDAVRANRNPEMLGKPKSAWPTLPAKEGATGGGFFGTSSTQQKKEDVRDVSEPVFPEATSKDTAKKKEELRENNKGNLVPPLASPSKELSSPAEGPASVVATPMKLSTGSEKVTPPAFPSSSSPGPVHSQGFMPTAKTPVSSLSGDDGGLCLPMPKSAGPVDEVAGMKVRQSEREAEYRKQFDEMMAAKGLSPESPEAARVWFELQRNREQQARVGTYKEDIWATTVKQMSMPGVASPSEEAVKEFILKNRERTEYEDRFIYVFISSSMPETTIRSYLDALGESQNVAFILRGMIGSDPTKFMPTFNWSQKLLCGTDELTMKDRDKAKCKKTPIDVNPVLFERFGITQVPAVVYAPNPLEATSCGDPALDEESFLVFYGDVHPIRALENIRVSVPNDKRLGNLIFTLTKSYFTPRD